MSVGVELTGVQATDPLLNARGQTHGRFQDHARITQLLKEVFDRELYIRGGRGQKPLNHQHLEAVEMILHKIGRIVAGDPNFKDHWNDIAGYAKLGSDACE